MSNTVIAASVGECVQVAGITNFICLAEAAGWRAVFFGLALLTQLMIAAAWVEKTDPVRIITVLQSIQMYTFGWFFVDQNMDKLWAGYHYPIFAGLS
jgi:hypothetical protein